MLLTGAAGHWCARLGLLSQAPYERLLGSCTCGAFVSYPPIGDLSTSWMLFCGSFAFPTWVRGQYKLCSWVPDECHVSFLSLLYQVTINLVP